MNKKNGGVSIHGGGNLWQWQFEGEGTLCDGSSVDLRIPPVTFIVKNKPRPLHPMSIEWRPSKKKSGPSWKTISLPISSTASAKDWDVLLPGTKAKSARVRLLQWTKDRQSFSKVLSIPTSDTDGNLLHIKLHGTLKPLKLIKDIQGSAQQIIQCHGNFDIPLQKKKDGWLESKDRSVLVKPAEVDVKLSQKAKLQIRESWSKKAKIYTSSIHVRHAFSILDLSEQRKMITIQAQSGKASRQGEIIQILLESNQYDRVTYPVSRRFVRGVDVTDGHLTHSMTDFTLKAQGIPFDFVRTYSNLGVDGKDALKNLFPMGAGWHHSFHSWLKKLDDHRLLLLGTEGTQKPFYKTAPRLWKGAPGNFQTVHLQGSDYVLRTVGGWSYRYRQVSSENQDYWLVQIVDTNTNIVHLEYENANPPRLKKVRHSRPGRTLHFYYYAPKQYQGYSSPVALLRGVEAGAMGDTGPLGIAFSYDGKGNLKQVLRGRRRHVYTYKNETGLNPHRMASHTDPTGITTRYSYLGKPNTPGFTRNQHRVSLIQDPDGRSLKLQYGSQSKEAFVPSKTTITWRRMNRVSTYLLQEDGQVKEIHEPLNRRTKYYWKPFSKRLDWEKDERNRKITYTYRGPGNIHFERMDLGNVSAFHQQSLKLPALPKKIHTEYSYSPLNQVKEVLWQEIGGSNLSKKQVINSYDSKGNITSRVEGGARKTKYKPYPNGLIKEKHTLDGEKVTFYKYNNFGQPIKMSKNITNSKKIWIHQKFDERGRLREYEEKYLNTSLRKTTWDYNTHDQVTLKVEFYGKGPAKTSRHKYNPQGSLEELSIEENNKKIFLKRFDYDLNGRQKLETVFPCGESGERFVTAYLRYNDMDQPELIRNFEMWKQGRKLKVRNNFYQQVQYDLLGRKTIVYQSYKENGLWQRIANYSYWGSTENIKRETDHIGNWVEYHYDAFSRVIGKKYPTGEWERFQYDSRGNLLSETDLNGHTRSYQYNTLGQKILERDPLGNEIESTYDAAGKFKTEKHYYKDHSRKSIKNKAPRVLRKTYTYHYDGLGRITQIQENLRQAGKAPLNYVTSTVYMDEYFLRRTTTPARVVVDEYQDSRKLLWKIIIDPLKLQLVSNFFYNAQGHLIKQVDPGGGTTSFKVDGLGKVREKTDPFNYVESFQHNHMGKLFKERDGNGVSRYTNFDYLGRITAQQVKSHNQQKWSLLRECQYFDAEKRYVVKDHSFGKDLKAPPWIEYHLDLIGRVDRITHSCYPKKSLKKIYKGLDLHQELDRRGNKISYFYDNLHRPLKTVWDGKVQNKPFHRELTKEYFDWKGYESETGLDQIKIEKFFDPRDRQYMEKRAGEIVWEKSYNSENQLVLEKKAHYPATQHRYDNAGRLIQTILPGSPERKLKFDYDKSSNCTKEWVAYQNENQKPDVVRHFDLANQLRTISDKTGNKSTYQYDGAGFVREETDPEGGKTQYERDTTGNVTRLIQSYGNQSRIYQMERDLGGRLRKFYDERDQNYRREYKYTGLGQVDEKYIKGRSGAVIKASYDYDLDGNLAKTTFQDKATIHQIHDPLGRVVKQWTPTQHALPFAKEIFFKYNEKEHVDTIISSKVWKREHSASHEKHYIYRDAFGRTLQETNPLGKSVWYRYKDSERKVSWIDSEGKRTHYFYDERGRLSKVESSLDTFNYSYTPEDRLEKIQSEKGFASGYEYYDNGWFKKIKHEAPGGAPLIQLLYSYNKVGDVKALVTRKEGKNYKQEFNYNHFYQLTEEIFEGNHWIYHYDTFGRRSSATENGKRFTYRYNALKQLESIVNPQGKKVASFSYTPNGQLAWTKTKEGEHACWYNALQQLTIYHFNDGALRGVNYDYDYRGRLLKRHGYPVAKAYLFADEKRLLEYDYQPDGSWGWVNRYEYGDKLLGIINSDKKKFFSFRDRIDSALLFVRSDNEHHIFKRYSAFGVDLNPETNHYDAYGFAGGFLELITKGKEDKMYQMGDRCYFPKWGRFTSIDPLESTEPEHLVEDPYVYVKNRPTLFVDPQGRSFELSDPGSAPSGYLDWTRETLGYDTKLYRDGRPELQTPSLEEQLTLPGPSRRIFRKPERNRRDRLNELREEYGIDLELDGEDFIRRETSYLPKAPLDTSESLQRDLEPVPEYRLSLEIAPKYYSEAVSHAPKVQQENGLAIKNNLLRSGATITIGALVFYGGLTLLTGPIGPITGFLGFLATAGGASGVGVGIAQGLTTPWINEEQSRAMHEALSLVHSTADPGSLFGMFLGAVRGGDLESMQDESFKFGLAFGVGEIVHGLRQGWKLNARFQEAIHPRSTYAWNQSTKKHVRTALGEAVVEGAETRVNPLFHNKNKYKEHIERKILSHFVTQDNIKKMESLRAANVDRLPFMDDILPYPKKWFNNPINLVNVWATADAMMDPVSYQMMSPAFKAIYAPFRKYGVEKWMHRMPPWLRSFHHSSVQVGRKFAERKLSEP